MKSPRPKKRPENLRSPLAPKKSPRPPSAEDKRNSDTLERAMKNSQPDKMAGGGAVRGAGCATKGKGFTRAG
jgi:hypothetical protein